MIESDGVQLKDERGARLVSCCIDIERSGKRQQALRNSIHKVML